MVGALLQDKAILRYTEVLRIHANKLITSYLTTKVQVMPRQVVSTWVYFHLKMLTKLMAASKQ